MGLTNLLIIRSQVAQGEGTASTTTTLGAYKHKTTREYTKQQALSRRSRYGKELLFYLRKVNQWFERKLLVVAYLSQKQYDHTHLCNPGLKILHKVTNDREQIYFASNPYAS